MEKKLRKVYTAYLIPSLSPLLMRTAVLIRFTELSVTVLSVSVFGVSVLPVPVAV